MGARKKLYEAIERVKSGQKLKVLVVAVQLPSGAIELITNYQDIPSKLSYYLDAYDDHCIHKANRDISIVNLMFV